MAVRNESVRLSLQDDFTTGMAKAAVATAMLRRELDSLGRVVVQSSRVNRDIDTIAKSANKADASINQLTGRLSLLADAVLTLGPGLAPIGAVGIAGVAGLANQLGIAAIAGGTAMAAFQGFGDALGAMNKAQLEPTAKNIEAARQAMGDLSPAAQEAVIAVQDFIPALKEVRDAAAEGLMPGFVEGIENLDPVLERTETLMHALGTTMGEVFADGVDSLGSERWADFFSLIEREGPATLGDLSSVVGDMAHGLTEMWEAFTPLNRDFSQWLVGVGDSFDGWASGLSETEGFQDFLAYVRETGPQVADTFAALGGALVDISTAAAPLGGTVLAALEAVANLVSSVADSNAGTGLLTIAAGLTAVNRAMMLTGVQAGSGMFGGITAGTRGARSSLGSFRKDVAAIGDSMVAFGSNAERTAAATERMRGRIAGVAKAGAGLGALTVASTGLADQWGIANMAVLGLAGSMLGPWGAAAGAAVGLTMDLAAANDGLEASYVRASEAAATFDVSGAASELAGLRAQREDLSNVSGVGDFFENVGIGFGSLLTDGEDPFDKLDTKIAETERQVESLRDGGARLVEMFGDIGSDGAVSMQEIEGALTNAAPAMQALGITVEDLSKAAQSGGLDALLGRLGDWQTEADSTAGRTGAVADAFEELDNAAASTADSAAALKTALDALLGPGLNVSAATDAFEGGLRDLNSQLAEGTRSLSGFGQGARQNREAVRGLASGLSEMLGAMAENGAGPQRLARALANGRAKILEFGDAAGMSRRELNGFLNEIGLTPRMVRTILKAQGFTDAQIQAMRLRTAFQSLPKNVRTDIKANGIPKSRAEIDALQRKYDLTPKQVQTLVALQKAAAEAGIANITRLLNALNGKTANTSVNNTITTTYVTRRVNEGTGLGPAGFGVAKGGVIDYYANGDIRNGHVAQIARAGAWRVWAEDETGGEAYIPLANDWRRNRAVSIWQETGRRLGQFAEGGLLQARMPAGVGGGGSPRVAVDLNGMTVTGTLQTPWGPAQIEGVAREAARRELDAQSRWEREQAR